MNDEIELVVPSKKYEAQAMNLIDEINNVDRDPIIKFSGASSLEKYRDNYDEWLELIEKYLSKDTVPNNHVSAHAFFAVRKSDDKVVGIINVRHELNDYLFNYGGHIGYSILPSERRKGYAYKQLLLGLDFCKSININKVLVTCAEYNIGSAKTIEKAGGILENIVLDPYSNLKEKRYWITIKD